MNLIVKQIIPNHALEICHEGQMPVRSAAGSGPFRTHAQCTTMVVQGMAGHIRLSKDSEPERYSSTKFG